MCYVVLFSIILNSGLYFNKYLDKINISLSSGMAVANQMKAGIVLC